MGSPAFPIASALISATLASVAFDGQAVAGNSIAAGFLHTCALNGDGGVECWGRNSEGQLGDGTDTERHTPVPVIGLQSGVTSKRRSGIRPVL